MEPAQPPTFIRLRLDGQEHLLAPPVLIGDSPDCALRLEPSPDISRTHAIIRCSGAQLLITSLRGALALQSGPEPEDFRLHRELPLQPGQRWRIGERSTLEVLDLAVDAPSQPSTLPDASDPNDRIIYTQRGERLLCQTRRAEVELPGGTGPGRLLLALLQSGGHSLSAQLALGIREDKAVDPDALNRLDKTISRLNEELEPLRGKRLIRRQQLVVELEWREQDLWRQRT